MTVLLYDKLMDFLKSKEGSVGPSQIAARVRELNQRYRFAGSHTGSTRVNVSMSFTSGRWTTKTPPV
jgi:hypothetical protein